MVFGGKSFSKLIDLKIKIAAPKHAKITICHLNGKNGPRVKGRVTGSTGPGLTTRKKINAAESVAKRTLKNASSRSESLSGLAIMLCSP